MKNKHLLLILLGFGLISCASFMDSRNVALGCLDWDGCRHSSHQVKTQYKNVEIQTDYNLVAYPKAEALNLKTGEKFHFGHSVAPQVCNLGDAGYEHCPNDFVTELCFSHYGSTCVLSRVNDYIYYEDLEDYQNKKAIENLSSQERMEFELILNRQNTPDRDINELIAESMTTQKAIDEAKARVKRKEALEKELLISRLQKRCEDYGFTGDTNIAACIQREAQHDKELEMQKWELEKTRVALQQAQSNSYIQDSSVEDEVPPLVKILGAIAEGYAEGYQQAQTINSLDSRYEKKSIYSNCKPNC